MMKEFKYDVKVLIQGVKERPCLWNKTLEVYKDRLERRNAWEEIFHLLDDRYEIMPAEERRLTGEYIINKWTNIRDTFVKSLKTKMGKPKRRYILHDLMKFLLTSNGEDPESEEEPVPFMKEEHEPEIEVPITQITPRKRSKRVNSDESYKGDSSYSKRRSRKETEESTRKSKSYDSSANDIDFVGIDEVGGEQRLMNEDEAFFASLLPTIVKYSEDERLEFRIEVLSLMKRIKDNRKWHE